MNTAGRTPRVLITTEALRDRPGAHLDLLADAGLSVGYPRKSVLLNEEDTLAELAGCAATIAGSEPYTQHVLAGLPELRIIARNGVGYERIDVAAATQRGVAVAITPAANHEAVAEHALALMLAVARSIVRNANDVGQGHWRRRTAFVPLRGRVLGIVGLGRIGRSVARRARAFGMRILAYDVAGNAAFAAEHGIHWVDLPTLLAQSDFVTLHLPLTPGTAGLINRQTLNSMKTGSILINTARGGLIVEDDLLAALGSGQLAGAGLDVLCAEPPPADHPLLACDNVVLSPHVAAFDSQALTDMAVAAARNIVDLVQGRWPQESLVNPEVQPNWRF